MTHYDTLLVIKSEYLKLFEIFRYHHMHNTIRVPSKFALVYFYTVLPFSLLVCFDKIAYLFTAVARLNYLKVIGLLFKVFADYESMAM